MASTIELFCAICFILLRLIVLNGVQGEFLKSFNNATGNESSWRSGRLKRSLADVMPKNLHIYIQDEMHVVKYVMFVKTSQKLANLHLPVDAPANYFFRDTVMNEIGEFVMYQDSRSSSAIVYFEKLKAIVNFKMSITFDKTYKVEWSKVVNGFGVFGTEYYFVGCPLQWDGNGMVFEAVKSPYLVKREGIPFQLGPNVFTHNEINKVQGTHEMDRNHEQIMNPQAGPSTRFDSIQEHGGGIGDSRNMKYNQKWRSGKYYLETLVFISKGVTDIYCNVFKDDCINEIVRYYLVYFNAVDLFFRKLSSHDMDISINIAKIVIEDDILTPFDFMSQREVRFTDLTSQLPAYLKKYSTAYPPDSFDHVFIVTELPIMLETTSTRALTKTSDDLISARAKGKFYEALPFTVIRAETYYSGYYHAAEEMAQVLSPDIDPLEYKERLEWTENSMNHFEAFFNENPNRVFFRNKPRSLLSPGPHVLITPEAQCRCFGFDLYKKRRMHSTATILGDECLKPLQCNREGEVQCFSAPIWPLDGTKCGCEKVCWVGRCVFRTY